MKHLRFVAWIGLAGTLAVAGCKKTDNSKANFIAAVNRYYAQRPACLWSDPIKFPVQVDSSDASKTQGYDALVDAGLLSRSTGEKKVFILGSKQVTNYDLSDKGRGLWVRDEQQPGYGNFCYGILKVMTLDSYTPTASQPGATTTVAYHAYLTDAPSWAQSPETQIAFPQVKADIAQPVVTSAVLTDTSGGWAVTSKPQGASGSTTNGITPPTSDQAVQ
jgi:hypothetical protein